VIGSASASRRGEAGAGRRPGGGGALVVREELDGALTVHIHRKQTANWRTQGGVDLREVGPDALMGPGQKAWILNGQARVNTP